MGTSYTIRVVVGDAPFDREDLEQAITERLERINDLMSTWRPESELSRFNRHQGTDWFPVSAETAEVVAAGIRIGRMTDGAFDITVGPLVRLWQFGPDPHPALPTPEELDATRTRVGREHLDVRLNPPALRKLRQDVEVDLSGIAKGYGVDAVARLLDERGLAAYLVEIGGEVRTRGAKPDGGGWIVGIEAPTPGRRSVRRTLELRGASLATSGDYRSFRDAEGRRWSHTIDPRTGRPIEHQLASVSVVAESCMESDALATALMVLGPDGAYDWARDNHVAALLVVRDGGGLVDRPTPEFARRFPASGPPVPPSMTTTILLAALIIGLAMAAMAVGLLGRRRLRGSCGGLSSLCRASGDDPACDACHVPAVGSGDGEDPGGERTTGPESDQVVAQRNASNANGRRP